jgi:hypothetical protein
MDWKKFLKQAEEFLEWAQNEDSMNDEIWREVDRARDIINGILEREN